VYCAVDPGASLKFTVLNPKGRVWLMVAGGGASVIYAGGAAGRHCSTALCCAPEEGRGAGSSVRLLTAWLEMARSISRGGIDNV